MLIQSAIAYHQQIAARSIKKNRPAELIVWVAVYFVEQLLKPSAVTLLKNNDIRQFFFGETGLGSV